MEPGLTSPSPSPPPVIAGFRAAQPRWRWFIHLALLAAYPLVVGVLSVRSPGGRPALGGDVRTVLLIVGGELTVFAAVFGLAWLASRANRDDLWLRWGKGLWPVPLGIAYSVALRFALAIPLVLLAGLLVAGGWVTRDSLQDFVLKNRPDVESVVDVNALEENPAYFWLSATLVSFILGGLREEFWRAGMIAGLRHVWPGVFASSWGGLGASFLAALVFGIGHLPQGPLAVVLTGLLGFGLGAIMVFHRSIWPAVIAHGAFNATSMALIPWVLRMGESSAV